MNIYILKTCYWTKVRMVRTVEPNVRVLVPKLLSMHLMKKSFLLWWLFSGAESEELTIENYQLHV